MYINEVFGSCVTPLECVGLGMQPDHTYKRCLPKCEEDEFYDSYQTK